MYLKVTTFYKMSCSYGMSTGFPFDLAGIWNNITHKWCFNVTSACFIWIYNTFVLSLLYSTLLSIASLVGWFVRIQHVHKILKINHSVPVSICDVDECFNFIVRWSFWQSLKDWSYLFNGNSSVVISVPDGKRFFAIVHLGNRARKRECKNLFGAKP